MYINKIKFTPKRYSSGELKLMRSYLDSFVCDGKAEILFENDFSIFELLLVLDYYKTQNIKTDLILSYLPYQRMDHNGRDELNTLQNVAKLFNNQNLDSITICEPHCDIKCFKNSKSLSLIKKMKDVVFSQIDFDNEQDFVVLTDKGGFQRYNDIAKNVVYFEKQRDSQTGLIVKQQMIGKIDPTKKILVVDDIISTGDTIVNILDELCLQGAKQIYIMSGHIENNKYNHRLFEFENVQKIYSTNSLRKIGTKKLKLFDVKELVYGHTKRTKNC